MQQYYRIETGSRTLTVFHTEDSVSFDVEHYGHFSVPAAEFEAFLSSTAKKYTVYENEAEKHPNLAERRPHLFDDEHKEVGVIELDSDGGLTISIKTGNPITFTLTPEQVETLQESITPGSVERYSNGQYPVESVNREGVRDRGEHVA